MRSVHSMRLFGLTVLTLSISGPASCQSTGVPGPALSYSAYLRPGFTPTAVATDTAGNVYLAGRTLTGVGTTQTAAMVLKLNPAGTQYLYVRTFGGSQSDTASAIAVDSSGNAYVTGTAASPDFPVTPGRQFATAAAGPNATRAFGIKLDPQGEVAFAELIGGSSICAGQAIAVTAEDNIVISGTADSTFPTTPGAYAATGTSVRPFLMELDPTGTAVKFAAYGIGGSALALDSTGNIYMSGATYVTDYPTTPGVYQPVFNPVSTCSGFCRILFPGTNQYLTKLDPTGLHIIYSTAVAGGGQTTNTGLALDSFGNAYLSGLTYGSYPFSVTDPGVPQIRPFLTKIDSGGKTALFSIPIGGAGVAVDNAGHVFTGGSYNNANYSVLAISGSLPSPPAGSVNTASQCLLNSSNTTSQGYLSELDAVTGSVETSKLIDSANLNTFGIALSATGVWIAGEAITSDVPTTPEALTSAGLSSPAGAYLGEVSFNATKPPDAPQLGCILDSASGRRPNAVTRYQTISLFGQNLGPARGVVAPDSTSTSLGGVSVAFDGFPAPILYASASQINVLVPAFPDGQTITTLQVSANGQTTPAREFTITPMNPNLFVNIASSSQGCASAEISISVGTAVAVAMNADGSLNSCDHPAHVGSSISIFLDGLGGDVQAGQFVPVYLEALGTQAMIDHSSSEVINIAAVTNYVWKCDILVPPGAVNGVETIAYVGLTISNALANLPVAPTGFGFPVVAVWLAP